MDRQAVIGILALSPAIDITYEVAELVRGGITRPTSVTRVPGGKGLNAARVAHAEGGEVSVVTALGGAAGEWIRTALLTAGIRARVTTIEAETRTCISIVERAGGTTSTDLYEPATPLTKQEWAEVESIISDTLTSWIAVSGSLPEGVVSDELVLDLEAHRGTRNGKVAVDTSGAALVALAPTADLLKVNRVEAASLLNSAGEDALADARAIHATFGCTAIVTDGVRNGAAVSENAAIVIPPPTRFGRFPAGSGDAFLGALLAALDAGAPLPDAVAAGASAAERNALVPGAGRLA